MMSLEGLIRRGLKHDCGRCLGEGDSREETEYSVCLSQRDYGSCTAGSHAWDHTRCAGLLQHHREVRVVEQTSMV